MVEIKIYTNVKMNSQIKFCTYETFEKHENVI